MHPPVRINFLMIRLHRPHPNQSPWLSSHFTYAGSSSSAHPSGPCSVCYCVSAFWACCCICHYISLCN